MKITSKKSEGSINMILYVQNKENEWGNNLKERTADATWEMLALKFIINYSPSEYTAANRALGDRKQELGATF